MLIDFFCKKKLCLMEKTGNGATFIYKLNCLLADGAVVAAEDGRAACLKEVKILVAVDIIEICALCFGDADGERIVERKVVLNAAGDEFLSLGGDFL